MTGFARHVNVPNIPPVARQQPNQRSAQGSHNNEMVLYLPSSNQVTQQVARATADGYTQCTTSIGSLADSLTNVTVSIN